MLGILRREQISKSLNIDPQHLLSFNQKPREKIMMIFKELYSNRYDVQKTLVYWDQGKMMIPYCDIELIVWLITCTDT